MDNPAMSSTFDILWNNINSNGAPGLNEAEKSVFLTKAQNQLVLEYFNVRTDGAWGGFDGSQKRQYDFSSITVTGNPVLIPDNALANAGVIKLDNRSVVFKFPSDYFLSVNEVITDSVKQYSVLPISYAEYQRLMLKPYAFPVKRGAWRLFTQKIEENTAGQGEDPVLVRYPIAEVIGKFGDGTLSYQLRYIKTLMPIILEDLSNYEDFNIDGYTEPKACELPAETHQEIVERAVALAKIAWQGGTVTQAREQSE